MRVRKWTFEKRVKKIQVLKCENIKWTFTGYPLGKYKPPLQKNKALKKRTMIGLMLSESKNVRQTFQMKFLEIWTLEKYYGGANPKKSIFPENFLEIYILTSLSRALSCEFYFIYCNLFWSQFVEEFLVPNQTKRQKESSFLQV